MLIGEALALEGVVLFKASCMRTGNQVKESIKNPNQTEPQRLPTKLRKNRGEKLILSSLSEERILQVEKGMKSFKPGSLITLK